MPLLAADPVGVEVRLGGDVHPHPVLPPPLAGLCGDVDVRL